LYSGFIQDEIDVVPGFLKLTIGSKFLHNVFTGYETQPTARLAFTPNDKNTIWTSVSRAVRIPTRFDHDITTTSIFGSEKVYAYELGYRVRPIDRLSLSLATFYNQYKHLRSLDSTSNPSQPIVLANSQKAQSWGIEFSGNFQATSWWRLRGGYTHFEKKIRAASSKVIPGSDAFEGVDPLYQFMFQSILDLPKDLQLDVVGRYIDTLPAVLTVIPHVPAYFTFDVRFAWRYKSLEFSVVGQNLYKDQHSEVSSSRIPRSVYGKITCRL